MPYQDRFRRDDRGNIILDQYPQEPPTQNSPSFGYTSPNRYAEGSPIRMGVVDPPSTPSPLREQPQAVQRAEQPPIARQTPPSAEASAAASQYGPVARRMGGGIIDTTANIPQVANAARATSALPPQGIWREGDPNMPESLRGTPSAPPQDARVLREGRGLMVGGMDYDPSIGINAQRAAQGVSPDLQRIQEGTQAMRSLQDAQRLEARRRAGDYIRPAGQAPSPLPVAEFQYAEDVMRGAPNATPGDLSSFSQLRNAREAAQRYQERGMALQQANLGMREKQFTEGEAFRRLQETGDQQMRNTALTASEEYRRKLLEGDQRIDEAGFRGDQSMRAEAFRANREDARMARQLTALTEAEERESAEAAAQMDFTRPEVISRRFSDLLAKQPPSSGLNLGGSAGVSGDSAAVAALWAEAKNAEEEQAIRKYLAGHYGARDLEQLKTILPSIGASTR